MNDNLIIVRQLPVIEDQLLQVKASIESRVGEALSLACTEDTYKAVKKARSELNKEYAELERRRKEVKASILAPYAPSWPPMSSLRNCTRSAPGLSTPRQIAS